jgi:TolB protein
MRVLHTKPTTWWLACVSAILLDALSPETAAHAQGAPSDGKLPGTLPDKLPDAPLGVVDVTGSAGPEGVRLQKLIVTQSAGSNAATRAVAEIVANDLTLSGQFEVLAVASESPLRTLAREPTAADLAPFAAQGAEIVVRIDRDDLATPAELSAAVYFPSAPGKKAAFAASAVSSQENERRNAHRLSDAVVGALTGKPGAFSSHLAFVTRQGGGQRIQRGDADGFGIVPFGPEGQVALSPTFGPGDQVYYALSRDMSPFALVEGEAGTPVAWPVFKGSLMGLAFSADRKVLALTVHNGKGTEVLIRTGSGDVTTLPSPPHAHHPVFGPERTASPGGSRLAWVAGEPPRVLVDGKPISPAGIIASSPSFCDSPLGLLVVFTLSSGADSAVYATDVQGGNLRRLSQSGKDESPACSSDGRLVAFFSRRSKDPGLYIMPITMPGRARRISDQLGSGLTWSRPLPRPAK